MSEYIVELIEARMSGKPLLHNLSCLGMEPIVRCRDCLHVSYDGVLSTGWCNENCREVRPDCYCSWGERKVE